MGDLNEITKPDIVYELNIGKSFNPGSRAPFYQFKCKLFNILFTIKLNISKLFFHTF